MMSVQSARDRHRKKQRRDVVVRVESPQPRRGDLRRRLHGNARPPLDQEGSRRAPDGERTGHHPASIGPVCHSVNNGSNGLESRR
jgi:hypothetical protein